MKRRVPSNAARTPGHITFEQPPRDLNRRDTHLYSFNQAIGGGLPLRTVMEIAGHNFSGKTTLAIYLAGLISPKGLIGIADIEPMQGIDYIERVLTPTGYTGRVRFMHSVDDKGHPLPSEKMLDELAMTFYDGLNAGIVDSVSALYPVSEEEGDVGEGQVGRRAQVMAQFMRKVGQRLRSCSQESMIFLVNHLRMQIGSQALDTPGGKAIQDYSATRLRMYPKREESYWVLEGKVTKRRFWSHEPPDAFKIVLVQGEGIHPGLTAVEDCLTYGLAEKDNGRVKLKAKKFGFMSKLVEKRADPDLFEPFVTALKGIGF